MKQPSPTLEGFRSTFRRPSLPVAEIAWRWSFGLAGVFLLTFAWLTYLDTLTVTGGDLFLLRTRHPLLVSHAIANIFRGSGPRFARALVLLSIALSIAWVVVASLSRAITVKAFQEYFRSLGWQAHERKRDEWRLRSLVGLNLLRLVATFVGVLSCVAAFLLGGEVTTPADPAPGSAFLIALSIAMLTCIAWCVMNWLLSLASVFVVVEGDRVFSAISSAVGLCRTRAGAVFAVGTWYGIAHLTAFVVATSVVAVPLAFAGLLPAGMVFGGALLVTLLYFGVADWIYAARLGAYVAILEMPEAPTPEPPLPPRIDPSPTMDRDELILSDLSSTTG